MTAPFTTQNYQDLIIILQLPPSEIFANSLLRNRGKHLEQIDTNNSTDFVGDVQSAICNWFTANDAKNTIMSTANGQGIKRQKVDGEYEVEFSDRGAMSKYDGYESAKRRSESEIRRLLQWDYSSRYVSFNTRANA